MNINNNTLLNTLLKTLPLTIQAKIEKFSAEGKIDLSSSGKEKGIQIVLQEILKELSTGSKNRSEIANILEQNKQSLKFKNIATDIKQIISLLPTDLKTSEKGIKLQEVLAKSLLDMNSLDAKTVKTSLENSGILLESKMGQVQDLSKNNMSITKNYSSDMKNILLQIKEMVSLQSSEETVMKELKLSIDKALSQIDYYQISSYVTNSNHTYLSFLQDDFEDVDIKFQTTQDDEFSCLIDLSLKEKGDLKILLQLDQKSQISINIGVENDDFKKVIQETLQKLRIQIHRLGLSIISLNIFDLDDKSKKSIELQTYQNIQNLDFGVDIKV